MKTGICLLIAAAVAALALPVSAQPQDEAAQRARIAEERARAETEFEQAHKACYARFAVNDCISDARARRREQMADLRRQELALNDAERRRRGEERLRDLESRTPPQPRGAEPASTPGPARSQEPGAARAAGSPADATPGPAAPQVERRGGAPARPSVAPAQVRTPEQPRASSQARPPAAVRTPPQRGTPSPGATPAPNGAPEAAQGQDTEENRRRYEERLREAQEHKAKVQKRAAESARKDVRPLPVPP